MPLPFSHFIRVFIDDVELMGVCSIHEQFCRVPNEPMFVTLEGYQVPGDGFDTKPYVIYRSSINDVLRYLIHLEGRLIKTSDNTHYYYTDDYATAADVELVRQGSPTSRLAVVTGIFRQYEAKGYTEPFYQDGEWWAFPPNGVMPVALKNS